MRATSEHAKTCPRPRRAVLGCGTRPQLMMAGAATNGGRPDELARTAAAGPAETLPRSPRSRLDVGERPPRSRYCATIAGITPTPPDSSEVRVEHLICANPLDTLEQLP
jgi:hypothetical protein